MTVAYDGSSFYGFAAQPGLRTVAGTLEEAVEIVVRHPVTVTGAGRTDRGVHARGQVVSFDVVRDRFDVTQLQRTLNKLCNPALAVRDVTAVDDDFDARFSARSRRYHYTIVNRPVSDPFLWPTSWHVAEPLELARLRLACDPLIGEHDFSSFCRRPKERGEPGAERDPEARAAISLYRRVDDAGWDDLGEGVLRFRIEANAFCHQMVRSIVGLMVDVGRGRRRAGDVAAIVAARDRSAAPTLAPARGLCLSAVGY
jgi:tRNA pseudouridine38-40 synthase